MPGRAVDFHALGSAAETVEQSTDRAIARRLDRRPLAGFPTSIAVVRAQGPVWPGVVERYGPGTDEENS